MAMLDRDSLESMGFASLGENVLISEKASFYNPGNISIASNVRIDDFCVLAAGTGGIEIGNYIHVGVGSTLIGKGKITLSDFSGLSSRVSIYSSSDDYSGRWMTNPMVPAEFTNVVHGDVSIGRHVIIGAGSIILPGVKIDEGVAVGALSLIRKNCGAFGIYFGVPAKKIGVRRRDLLELEKKMRESTR